MQPVEDTRRERLKRLVQQEGGLANLCAKLSLSRKETSGLSRILNANIRHERGGVPYVMGSQMARDIDQAPVFLAKSSWETGYVGERFPKIAFTRTKERG